ncbi:MAG: hypothetical protein R3E53_13190 [Myxococcota bacterium]
MRNVRRLLAAGAADAQLDRVLRALTGPRGAGLRGARSSERAVGGGPTRAALCGRRGLLPRAVRSPCDALRPERVSPVGPFGFPEYVEEGLLDGMLEAD